MRKIFTRGDKMLKTPTFEDLQQEMVNFKFIKLPSNYIVKILRKLENLYMKITNIL